MRDPRNLEELLQYMKSVKGVNIKEVCDTIGMPRSTLSAIRYRSNERKQDAIFQRIKEAFPQFFSDIKASVISSVNQDMESKYITLLERENERLRRENTERIEKLLEELKTGTEERVEDILKSFETTRIEKL
ncbi:MAG: hypothetical protein GY751_01830, partial [Bacteroidetes bacterium]|nr:hypothetical protein [Bacteroidota bacterium]